MVGTDTGRAATPPADGPPSTRRSPSCIGFSAVFVALWASVGLIGYVLRDYVGLLRQLGGALLVFMGLHVAGVINVSALYREVRLPIGPMGGASLAFGQAGPSAPELSALDRSSASSSRPAGRPASDPSWAASSGSPRSARASAQGTVLLVAYAAGLAIPFILVAVGATAVSDRLGWLRDHHRGRLEGDRRDARRWSAS